MGWIKLFLSIAFLAFSQISFAGPSELLKGLKELGHQTRATLSSPLLVLPFFRGPFIENVPHIPAKRIWGHTTFLTGSNIGHFTEIAKTTPNGLATLWVGPLPFIYVVDNATRLALIQESKVGVIDDEAHNALDRLTNSNHVMTLFPAFMPIDSATYKAQRKFLMNFFHHGAKKRLPMIAEHGAAYLSRFSSKHPGPTLLRDFVTATILHTSSFLLGLSENPMDTGYFEDSEYYDVINKVTHYGISEIGDAAYEKKLYRHFEAILKANYDAVRSGNPKTNLIQAIFASREVDFPYDFEGYLSLPQETKHAIAMNFMAIIPAGKIHSTSNSLDWALARLLREPNKFAELTRLMDRYRDADLTDSTLYEKGGSLFPIAQWILHNVFLNPPFSHQFFYVKEDFLATLPDRSEIVVPSKSQIVVNYVECNRSQTELLDLETFTRKMLSNDQMVGRLVTNTGIASFGGGRLSWENTQARTCPGAKTSLYEQSIILALIIRDYSITVTEEMSTEPDLDLHPYWARKNLGKIKVQFRGPISKYD